MEKIIISQETLEMLLNKTAQLQRGILHLLLPLTEIVRILEDILENIEE